MGPLLLGLVCGAAFFFIVHPLMEGFWPRPILERSAFIGFMFRGYPFVVLPFLVLAVSLFRPKTTREALRVSLVLSFSMLIPVPVVNYWLVAPSLWGMEFLDQRVLRSVMFSLLYQSVFAIVATLICSLVSPSLFRFLSWCWETSGANRFLKEGRAG